MSTDYAITDFYDYSNADTKELITNKNPHNHLGIVLNLIRDEVVNRSILNHFFINELEVARRTHTHTPTNTPK